MPNRIGTHTNPDLWLKCPRPLPWARLRLFCFPYAGGGIAHFHAWPQLMPPEVEVRILQLPGRESRMGETPFRCFLPMIHAVTSCLAQLTDLPFAFFGHSMGALIAFEAARLLRRRNGSGPLHLFVSGCPAPQSMRRNRAVCHWSDAQFVEELRRLNGTPSAVLDDPELLQLFLPLLRADFAVCASYAYVAGVPLACPLTAYGGLQDRQVSSSELTEWRHQTDNMFRQQMFPGDHFFLHNGIMLLIQSMYALLADITGPQQTGVGRPLG